MSPVLFVTVLAFPFKCGGKKNKLKYISMCVREKEDITKSFVILLFMREKKRK